MLIVFSVDQEAYELTGNQYSVYGIQYQPGFDNAVRSLVMPDTYLVVTHGLVHFLDIR